MAGNYVHEDERHSEELNSKQRKGNSKLLTALTAGILIGTVLIGFIVFRLSSVPSSNSESSINLNDIVRPVESNSPNSEQLPETAIIDQTSNEKSQDINILFPEEDMADMKVSCQEVSNDGEIAVFLCSARGFEGVNESVVTVDVKEQSIISIEVTVFSDTEGVGDIAVTDAELARYQGAKLSTSVDVTSGATFTSNSIRAMAAAALLQLQE